MRKSCMRVSGPRGIEAGGLHFDACNMGLPEAVADVLVETDCRPAADVEERRSRRIDVDRSKGPD